MRSPRRWGGWRQSSGVTPGSACTTVRVEDGAILPTGHRTPPKQPPICTHCWIVDTFPGQYVLAGHSFGGLYVLTFAATYPDQVAGLVLLDSTAPVPGPVPQPRPGPTTSSVASPRCCQP